MKSRDGLWWTERTAGTGFQMPALRNISSGGLTGRFPLPLKYVDPCGGQNFRTRNRNDRPGQIHTTRNGWYTLCPIGRTREDRLSIFWTGASFQKDFREAPQVRAVFASSWTLRGAVPLVLLPTNQPLPA